jgi:TIR domain
MARKRSASKRKPSEKPVKQQAAKTSPAQPAAYTVFISHSSKESWIAKQIAKEIMALGAETWLDVKDLRGGDEIRRSIKRGIRASQEAVVLLSANSITSQWVIYEAGIAYGQGKRITPILNNLAPDETIAPLQGIKALDLNDFDNFLVELAGRIKKRLGQIRKAAV